MTGGDGNDPAVGDNAGDVVPEASGVGSGIDTVQSSISYTLGANVENLTLTGSTAINGTGNGDANVITGNSGNNVLTGGGGNDTLVGNAGTDTASYTGTLTAANITAVVDGEPTTAGNQAGWQVVASGGQGTDLLTGIEKITDGTGHNFLLVGNGGYATIQEAVDAAASGDTIIVGAGTFAGANIGKELTLIGQGVGQTIITTPMTGSPPSSVGFQLVGDIDATAGDLAATVTIKGFGFVGNTVGVRVSSSTNLDHLVITNSDFHDNTSNGVGMGSGAPLLSAIDIVDSTFSHNGIATAAPGVTASGSGSGDISLFNFHGDALIKNVTVHGGDVAVSDPLNANFAIQVAGFNPSTHAVNFPLGNVVFDNVSVTGAYSKTLLYVQGYTDLDGLTFLNTGTSLNGSAGWGIALAIDPTSDQTTGFDSVGAAALAPDVVNLSNVTAVNNIVVNVPPGHPLFAYNGMALATTFAGTPVADQITGTSGVDVISGGAGNDTLNGGAGADALIGGDGNDTYIVDNVGDVVTELANVGSGTDTVQSSVTFKIGRASWRETVSASGYIYVGGV
jgi:Ca2+-binding RTX toxin-like protein